MKRILLIIALLVVTSAVAQRGTPNTNAIRGEGHAPYRTRFMSYDIRGEAERGEPRGSKYYQHLSFVLRPGGETPVYEEIVNIPSLWLERDIYIRDKGHTGRYLLTVNGTSVGVNSDTWGGGDFYITPYLKEGENRLTMEFRNNIPGDELEFFTWDVPLSPIENLYIWSQPKIHVLDYTIAGYPNAEGTEGVVELDVVMVNGYNFPEKVNVGFDIYDPAGNLKSYTFTDVTIRGLGADTVHLRDKLFGFQKYFYTAEQPSLYKVVITVKYAGRPIEYIPLRLGFGATEWDGERVLRGGVPLTLTIAEWDEDKYQGQKSALAQLRYLKQQDFNTLYLHHPAHEWFYDMCEREGMYVIDCASVECDPRGDDRGVGGTVANAPKYLSRFIDRQQSLYYRGRNRANIVGWNIGTPSGNGYNMYKSYQWLKAADPTRMVIYDGVGGEWNSDVWE
ncbi:MAG: hypothetical protein LBM63_03700 [Rikenellaceae bacterium]|jgi:beta-galactosidase|nr:hypothetical protein [Rikenellaceae bacterium]